MSSTVRALYCTLSLLQISEPCFNSKTVFFFCCFKENEVHGFKTGDRVCIWGMTPYLELLRVLTPIPLPNYFGAFNTNLNNVEWFFYTTRAGRLQEWLQGEFQPYSVYVIFFKYCVANGI